MRNRDYLISCRQALAETTYKDLGELSDPEIAWLGEMTSDHHRKRYLASIYGTVTMPYAFQQYNKRRLASERADV